MDHADWRQRLDTTIATLQSLTPAEFFDETTLRYHSVERDIDDITRAFHLDRAKLEPVLAGNPLARACWLPIDPSGLDGMNVAEIYWRLGENLADERNVDGALEEPFESGSLVAALMRIRDGLDQLVIRTE